MEWLLLVLIAGGGGAYAGRKLLAARGDRRESAAQLAALRRLVDEDVIVFGEQLQRLGDDVAGVNLDGDSRLDQQSALDTYERAQQDAPRIAAPDEVSSVIGTLASGRYAMVCVRTRAAGEPVPELRAPCFFNPQHGPSDHTTRWSSTRTGTRTVPVCLQCAEQLEAGEKPDVRTVPRGSRTVPYWEAGAAVLPYSRGYFPADAAAAANLQWMFAAPSRGRGHHGSQGGDALGDFGGAYGEAGGFAGGGYSGAGMP